ncbi:hypothetical protein C8255_02965 [filamentous cyanobacterium CCP3]|nr:hypothetical protein C8255_02965 [filamentous cyanobacterium CCP3]
MQAFRLVLRCVMLRDGVALNPQISGAIWIEFIDAHLGRVSSHQQCAMSGRGFVDGGFGSNARQCRGQKRDRNRRTVSLLQHTG